MDKKTGSVLALAALLIGCAPQRAPTGLLPSSAQAAIQRMADTTLASGWRVDCLTDDIKATRECFASTFGTASYGGDANIPFRIVFRSITPDGPLVGPILEPGLQNWPGTDNPPTVRIDSNDPIENMQDPALFREMDAGVLAKAEYWVWPTGPERMSVKLAGFHDAYQLLLAKVGNGQSF